MMMTFLLAFLLTAGSVSAETARDIVKKADELIRSKSSYSVVEMTIVKPGWSRTMSMKLWALEPDYALIYVSSPARDKGTVTLKRKNEVWNWLPSVQRVIKIPPSMMLQSWMGSDFTNDDLVRESSVVNDYTHSLIGEETMNGYKCHKIKMTPKPEAGVVWGKIIVWISKDRYLQTKADYYSEDGKKVKTFTGSMERKMGGRSIFAKWEMIPENKPGNRTILEYKEIIFNYKVRQSYFSEQNMKRVR